MFNANKDPKLYNLAVIFFPLKLKTLEKVYNFSVGRKIQKMLTLELINEVKFTESIIFL